MTKYPFVKQNGLKDCGVASLKMIIRYYGGDYPIGRLRELTNTTKEGTSAYDLIEGAKKIGLDGVGYKVGINDIKKEVLPAIAYTVLDNSYQHYMVIYDINFKKKELIIADPATKLKKIKFEEFSNIFQNVILVYNPLHTLKKYKENSFLKKEILNIIKNNKLKIILLFLFTLITTLLSITLITSSKIVIDCIQESIEYFKTIIFIYLIIIFIRLILETIKNHFVITFMKNISKTLYEKILFKIFYLPYQYYRNRTTGELISRIQNVEKVSEFIILTFTNLIINISIILFSSIYIIFINYYIFLFLFLFTFIICVASLYYDIKRKNIMNEVIEKNGMLNSYLVESISGFETVKGLNIEKNVYEKAKEKYETTLTTHQKFIKCSYIESNIQQLLMSLGMILLIIICFFLLKNKYITISDYFVLVALYNYYTTPFLEVIDWFHKKKEMKLNIESIEDLFYEEEIKDNKKKQFITIKYMNLNVKISFGQKIILLGKSGVGKSTLLKMIKGYYPKNNITSMPKDEIIYISQNEILFTDTIFNNLLLGNNNEKELNKVIDLCELNPIINSKKLGGYTLIEENGYNLSGGEKQRIILARALLKNPKILLIDEGLSQINIDLERKILKNIIDYYKDMTIIFVSHRSENCDLFDSTLYLERKA